MSEWSRLGRLFLYAGDAQENFTTEALRIAIEADPVPMIEALCALRTEPPAGLLLPSPCGYRVRTQVELPPHGWLDLVMDLLDASGRALGAVWVEVKIAATETGRQLDWYRERAVQETEGGYPTWVVTLANEHVRTDVPNIFWSDLYQRARRGHSRPLSWAEHRAWEDFGKFLEEQAVTNDALGPVSDVEAASLGPAYQLICKVSEIVKAVEPAVPEFVPGWSHWASSGQLLNFVGNYFRQSGNMMGQNGTLGYGLETADGTAYWFVALDPVRGAFTRRATEEIRRETLAMLASLGDGWTHPAAGDRLVFARVRAGTLGEHPAVVAWMKERIKELAGSGVMSYLLTKAGASGASGPEAGDAAMVARPGAAAAANGDG